MLGAQRSAYQVTGAQEMVAIKSNHLFTDIQGPVPDSTITSSHTGMQQHTEELCARFHFWTLWLNKPSTLCDISNQQEAPLWSPSHFHVIGETFLH